jgi:hypothetical protein
MSGVNRNILKNTAIPVMGEGVTNIELVTTSRSRFVLLNFPPTFLSSSNGGSCTGITLQWSPDPSFGFEDASAYYAVTQSALLCEASSNSPLSSSLGWNQFIDSEYTSTAPPYYLRAWQNKVGGGRGPYSDIVEIQTRANVTCGTPENSAKNGVTSRVVFDVDGFNPTGSVWYSNNGGPAAPYSASFSVTPNIVKRGGPNFDGIATNGATITVPLQGTSLTQGGGTSQTIIGQIALQQGSATMNLGGGATSFSVTATTSSIASSSVQLSLPVGTIPYFPSGVNTVNNLIGFSFQANGGFTLDNQSVPGASGGTISSQIAVTNNLTITTSADCVIRVFYLGVQGLPYDSTIYHCKYGPGGA